MALLLIEALLALALLLFIVWWTMFSGRRKGELQDATAPEDPSSALSGRGDGLDSGRPAGGASGTAGTPGRPEE
ncbi:MAG: hypothetical protein LW854_03465 [Rubrivivax sp.]|nr:hypothetical protein [Rubrivivax sp.]